MPVALAPSSLQRMASGTLLLRVISVEVSFPSDPGTAASIRCTWPAYLQSVYWLKASGVEHSPSVRKFSPGEGTCDSSRCWVSPPPASLLLALPSQGENKLSPSEGTHSSSGMQGIPLQRLFCSSQGENKGCLHPGTQTLERAVPVAGTVQKLLQQQISSPFLPGRPRGILIV